MILAILQLRVPLLKICVKLTAQANCYMKGSLTGQSMASMVPADLALSSSLSKLLDYIPKASHQDLFPYLTTSLCPTKTPRSNYQNSLFGYID